MHPIDMSKRQKDAVDTLQILHDFKVNMRVLTPRVGDVYSPKGRQALR